MDSTLVLILIQISALSHGYTLNYDYDPDILTNIAERLTPRDPEHDALTQNKRVLKVVPFTKNKKWRKKLETTPPEIRQYKDIPIAVIVAATKDIPDENTFAIEDFNHTEANHTNDKTSSEDSVEIDHDQSKEDNTDEVKSHKDNASEDLNENRKMKSKGDAKIDDNKSKVVNTDEVKDKSHNHNASEDLEDVFEIRNAKYSKSKEINGKENNLDVTDDDTKIADDNDMEDINDKIVLIDTLNTNNDIENEVNEIVSIKTVGDKKGKVNKISINEPIVHHFDDFKVEIQKEEPGNVIRSVIPKSKDDDDAYKNYNLWFIFNK